MTSSLKRLVKNIQSIFRRDFLFKIIIYFINVYFYGCAPGNAGPRIYIYIKSQHLATTKIESCIKTARKMVFHSPTPQI